MEITRSTDNGDFTLTLKGLFTFADNSAFRHILSSIPNPEIRQIIFDMQQVEFIDSAALGMLLLAHDESIKHQKPIILRGAEGQVAKMLKMACFDEYFLMQ